MKLCDRCSVSGCCLSYLSEACANARKAECPEVQPNRAEYITNMNMYQLENELVPMILVLCEDGVPSIEYIRDWLNSPKEDDDIFELK